MPGINTANSESADFHISVRIADGSYMNQDQMRQRMKKDRIKRNSQGHLFIRCNGEEKRLIDWLKDDRVTVSETQLRRRVREYELGSLNMDIERILFKPVNKKCRSINKKIMIENRELTFEERWRQECMRVTSSILWSPAAFKRS